MKKAYSKPMAEVVRFNFSSAVIASGCSGGVEYTWYDPQPCTTHEIGAHTNNQV